MRLPIALAVLVAALAAAGSAQAGGWATVGVAPLPTDIDAGQTWRPEITVLQHGRTPLAGLSPTITIRESGSGFVREFSAARTAEPGVYAAEVVFPEPGQWNVLVETNWRGEGSLTFGPETIGGSPAGGSLPDEQFPLSLLAVLAIVLAVLAAAVFGVRRVWKPTPAGR